MLLSPTHDNLRTSLRVVCGTVVKLLGEGRREAVSDAASATQCHPWPNGQGVGLSIVGLSLTKKVLRRAVVALHPVAVAFLIFAHNS